MPSELLKPISWTTTWKYGLVTNIDEPFATPDGSSIGEDDSGVYAQFQMSDISNIREGVDSLESIIIKLRIQSEIDPADDLPNPYIGVYWLINGTTKGLTDFVISDRGRWDNYYLTSPQWDLHIQGMTVAQLNTLEILIYIYDRSPDTTPVLVQVDTLEVEIVYSIPPPIEIPIDEGDLVLTGKTLTRTTNDFVRPTIETLDLELRDSEFIRADTIRIDQKYALLNSVSPTLVTTSYPAKIAATLSGKVPVLSYVRSPAADDLDLTGKVPDLDATLNQWITVPRSHLGLQGGDVGLDGDELPAVGDLDLTGKVPTLAYSWTVAPDAATLTADIPPSPERIWPESWTPNGWLGDIENIDEPLDEADGLVIYTNQPSLTCTIDFSDVQDIRDGVDTITGLLPSFRIRASAATKLYYYIYVEDTFRASGTLSTSGGVFENFILPDFLWGPFVAGTDTGPINSFQMKLAIFDSGVTVDVDVISLDVVYDRVTVTNPLLGEAIITAKGTVSLQGKAVGSINSGYAIPTGSLSLVGQQPLLFRSLILELSGKGVALDAALPVPGTALAFTGKAPIVRSIIPDSATLSLIGKRPAFVFGTVIPPGDHGIISLSTRYDIEHIATPTDELEF
jgi:hypothetical protein